MNFRVIIDELKEHIPFTLIGSIIGILTFLVIIYLNLPRSVSRRLFWSLHPLHVLLSALATTSMYRLHSKKNDLLFTILIGYTGAIFIATLSDSLIPYLGEYLLDLPNRGVHIGFIEKWWLVNPLAFAGVGLALVWPRTKFPHSGHVFLSTYSSLFHMAMATGEIVSFFNLVIIAIFLFLAVWVPCCASDVVFPLLFSGEVKHSH
ncbi:MAG: hypothetical protein ACQEP7_07550 [bacterium]